MDRTQLKQRIVGAIVLVALGVIFIPIILDREEAGISGSNIPDVPKQLEKLADRQLPATPAMPTKPETTRQIVDEHTEPVKTPPAPDAVTDTSTAKPDKPEKATQPPTEGKQRAWVVQVASFSERKKALALRDRLRKAKYITFVESISSKQNVLYRVRVGPVIKRTEAEDMQKKIAKQFKLKDALVMAHP